MYEEAKRRAGANLGCSPQELPTWCIAATSGTAAALAGVVTHPLDVIKTRLQVGFQLFAAVPA
jgi:hypothetical protein